MSTPPRILVVTDRTEASRECYPHAASLARALGGSVTLLYVDALASNLGRGSDALVDYIAHEHAAQEDTKAHADEDFAALGVPVTSYTEIGIAADVIPRYAEEHRVDCVVLPRATTEDDRHVFGETLGGVLRHSGVPVLVVPPGTGRAPGGALTYRRILAPTALDDMAGVAFDVACRLGGAYDAEVILYHAVEPPYVVPVVTMSAVTDALVVGDRELSDPAMEATRQRMLELCAHVPPGLSLRTRFDKSELPAEAIDQAATAEQADLIVLAAHTRGAVARFVIGSTAEDIVHDSAVPVLVLPERYLGAHSAFPPQHPAVFAHVWES